MDAVGLSWKSVLSWRSFDSLLRGKMTLGDSTRLMLGWLSWQALCASVFGLSLGVYALTSREFPDWRYMLGDFIKMPLLLLLTSAVTCPSLYVFGALRGLRFSAREFAAMLMVAHTVLAAVLGSLAPVIAFFALTTDSYSFMVLLTVAACGLGGILGVQVFVRAVQRPAAEESATLDGEEPEAVAEKLPAYRMRRRGPDRTIWRLLGWWVALYIFVGTQMGWMLRPFIGSPELEFQAFRSKGGNFIESVIHHVGKLAER